MIIQNDCLQKITNIIFILTFDTFIGIIYVASKQRIHHKEKVRDKPYDPSATYLIFRQSAKA